jgi:hypothetical protein
LTMLIHLLVMADRIHENERSKGKKRLLTFTIWHEKNAASLHNDADQCLMP